MKLSCFTVILNIILIPFSTITSDMPNLSQMRIFNLRMRCHYLPYLTELHTFSTPDEKIHATFHLTTSNNATRNAIYRHLFSEEKKIKFQTEAKTKNPSLSPDEIEQLFQDRQHRALEQATDPRNFATLKPYAEKALSFNFIDKQTVEVSLALVDENNPFVRQIKLFDTHEFSPEPPIVTFNAQNHSITQTFNIQHKDSVKKRLHAASWLYMKKINFPQPSTF